MKSEAPNSVRRSIEGIAMGSWGYGSMENDYALDWVAARVELPITITIKDVFEQFIAASKSPDSRIETVGTSHHEVEAAAMLLVDYALPANREGASYEIYIGDIAHKHGVWDLASKSIRKILDDAEWIDGWNDPAAKREILNSLLSRIDELKEYNWMK